MTATAIPSGCRRTGCRSFRRARRDRQQPDIVVLNEFMRSLIDEIVQAESIPGKSVVLLIPEEIRVLFDRGHLNQILWNLVRNAWQHCQKKDGSIRIAARPGYMGDAVICELNDDGPGIPPKPAVIGRAEYLYSCSQAALRDGSTMIFPICH